MWCCRVRLLEASLDAGDHLLEGLRLVHPRGQQFRGPLKVLHVLAVHFQKRGQLLDHIPNAGRGCPVIHAPLQLGKEELGVETIDGGDVGENELHHVLREGLAAACLPQQLLEEHLHRKPAPAHALLKEEVTTR